MIYYNSNLIEELKNLSPNNKQRIIQAIHWAISENELYKIIDLPDFRNGEQLKISKHEYSELYNAISKN